VFFSISVRAAGRSLKKILGFCLQSAFISIKSLADLTR
jgi:hypothetical protein